MALFKVELRFRREPTFVGVVEATTSQSAISQFLADARHMGWYTTPTKIICKETKEQLTNYTDTDTI